MLLSVLKRAQYQDKLARQRYDEQMRQQVWTSFSNPAGDAEELS